MELYRKRALLECSLYKRAAEVADEMIRKSKTEEEIGEYLRRLRTYRAWINEQPSQPPAA